MIISNVLSFFFFFFFLWGQLDASSLTTNHLENLQHISIFNQKKGRQKQTGNDLQTYWKRPQTRHTECREVQLGDKRSFYCTLMTLWQIAQDAPAFCLLLGRTQWVSSSCFYSDVLLPSSGWTGNCGDMFSVYWWLFIAGWICFFISL